MTTTITKSIGNFTRDYTLLQAWADACPSNLVTSDIIYRGECYNDGEIKGQLNFAGGYTTDASHYIHLTAAVGHSFADHPNKNTNPLRPDQNKGVLLTGGTDGYTHAIYSPPNYTRVDRLQINPLYGNQAFYGGGGNYTLDTLIIKGRSTGGGDKLVIGGASTLSNVCFIGSGGAANAVYVFTTGTVKNCTFVTPTGVTSTGKAIENGYGTAISVVNCAMFGYAGALAGSTSGITFTNCYTDDATPPTGCTTVAYNTTTGSGFESITSASPDFRLKSTSALINTGSSSLSTLHDIRGYARNNGNYDVGAWEFKAGTQTITRSIGTGGDYSTLQAWADACPTDLVAADIIWRGEVKRQRFYAAGNILTMSGSTVDASHYKELTAEAGASFVDNPNAKNNPLRADAGNGALICGSAVYISLVSAADNFTRISRLQFSSDDVGAYQTVIVGYSATIDSCIFENGASSNVARQCLAINGGTVYNSLMVTRGAGTNGIISTNAGVKFVNCTIVCLGTPAPWALYANFSDPITFDNCAVFGTVSGDASWAPSTPTKHNSFGDMTAATGGWNLTTFDTTGGSGFYNLTPGQHDLRIKPTSKMYGAGASAYAPSLDIIGIPRSVSAPSVGAFELDSRFSVTNTVGKSVRPVLSLKKPRTMQPRTALPVTSPLRRFNPVICIPSAGLSAYSKLTTNASAIQSGPSGVGLMNSEFTPTITEYPSPASSGNYTLVCEFVAGNIQYAMTLLAVEATLGDSVSRQHYLQVSATGHLGAWSTAASDWVGAQTATGFVAKGIRYRAVAVFTAGGGRKLFVDGVLVASDSTARSPASMSKVFVGHDTQSNGTVATNGTNGWITLACAIPTLLSDTEAASLSANPWQLFAPTNSTPKLTLAAPRDLISNRSARMLPMSGPVPSTVGPVVLRPTAKFARYTQPQQAVAINWANPIARGLIGAFLPGSLLNLADQTALATAGTITLGAGARGIRLNSGAYEYPAPVNSSAPEAKFDLTVVSALIVAQQTTATNVGEIMCRGNGSSAPGWSVGLHGGSLNGPYVALGSYNPGVGEVDMGTGWTLSPHNVLLTGDGSNLQVWTDGVKVFNTTYTAPTYQYDTVNHRRVIFGLNGQLADTSTRPNFGLVWNRALSATEAASISANPWQIFVANPNHIWGAR